MRNAEVGKSRPRTLHETESIDNNSRRTSHQTLCLADRLPWRMSERIMPFHSHHQQHGHGQAAPNSANYGIFNAALAASSIAAPTLRRDANNSTTTAGTDALQHNDSPTNAYGPRAEDHVMAHNIHAGRGGLSPSAAPLSAPVSTVPSESQQFSTPRRTNTQRYSGEHYATYPPQQTHDDPTYAGRGAPSFSVQQATPQASSSILPSNATATNSLPGALQPAGGIVRPAPSSAYTAPTTVPTMSQPPIQTNASHYANAQPPSRGTTLHGHSRSSPSGMEAAQKYIPFNQTPSQTPITSNPKAYNISNAQTPSAGPSHSPLNLTDIRSRAISDANEGAQGTAFFSYSDSPTNSNYLAPFPTYAYDWCKWPVMGGSGAGKMAVGSYLEDPHNFIQILDTQIAPQEGAGANQAPYGLEYSKVAEATCAYPVTRILWEPPSSQKTSTDLLATSGDHLRLWSLPAPGTPHGSNNINRTAAANSREPPPQKLQPLALLSNSKTPEHTAPLTSLDWNTLSPKLIITSSIDTTCTIWDIPTLTAKTQLIAHDKEVFDVRFCAGSVDVFVSCGADGSVRMFDLRSLEHSTIIYEPAEKSDKCKCSRHELDLSAHADRA